MTTGSPTNPLEVLLVEDNPADARLTEEILKDSDYTLKLSVVEDGEAAIAYLRREGEYATAPRPDLILLDLMLPKKSGQEVLAEMNEDAGLTTIPVMILTGTEAEQSLLWSYNIPPSRFLPKTGGSCSLQHRRHTARYPCRAADRPGVPSGCGAGGGGRSGNEPKVVVAFWPLAGGGRGRGRGE